jgi:hypothetical protein
LELELGTGSVFLAPALLLLLLLLSLSFSSTMQQRSLPVTFPHQGQLTPMITVELVEAIW